jgi:type I restriction enzyme M protein
VDAFRVVIENETQHWQKQTLDNEALKKAVERLAPLAETSRNLVKQADLLYKVVCRLIDICEYELAAKESDLWVNREIVRARKASDEARQVTVEQLKRVRYFHRQAAWLTERFPDGVLRDVEGLVKLVDRVEIAANDWSLTPGRYVGVAPEEEDDGFDFEEALRDIHTELEGLNAEAIELAAKVKKNFEEREI